MPRFTLDHGSAIRLERVRNARKLSATALDFIPLDRPVPAPIFDPAGKDSRPFAESRDPCLRCGTRGDFGCEHQRPFQASDLPKPAADPSERHGAQRHRRYTEEDDRSLVLMLRKGEEVGVAAERLGRRKNSIYSRIETLRRNGVIPATLAELRGEAAASGMSR